MGAAQASGGGAFEKVRAEGRVSARWRPFREKEQTRRGQFVNLGRFREKRANTIVMYRMYT
jgi:hypothetical protein